MKQHRILSVKRSRLMILVLAMGFMTAVAANAQSLSLLLTFDTEDALDNPPLINPGSPKFSGVIAQGRDGNLYGTTPGGGLGAGAIYQISPSGPLGWIYTFTGTGTDGTAAVSGLTLGTDGNFYGTTVTGGASNRGTIFQSHALGHPGYTSSTQLQW